MKLYLIFQIVFFFHLLFYRREEARAKEVKYKYKTISEAAYIDSIFSGIDTQPNDKCTQTCAQCECVRSEVKKSRECQEPS